MLSNEDKKRIFIMPGGHEIPSYSETLEELADNPDDSKTGIRDVAASLKKILTSGEFTPDRSSWMFKELFDGSDLAKHITLLGNAGTGKTKLYTPMYRQRGYFEKINVSIENVALKEPTAISITAPTIIVPKSKFWTTNVFSASNKHREASDFESSDFELYKDAIRGLPNGFGESLRYIMSGVPITIHELAEKVKMSDRQLGRYINDPSLQPKLKTVMALCMGLRLFPRFSMHLLEQAGFILRDNNEGLAYQLLVHEFYADGIEVCNMMLEQMGLEPFYPPEKE